VKREARLRKTVGTKRGGSGEGAVGASLIYEKEMEKDTFLVASGP